jgi:hypothetical protein
LASAALIAPASIPRLSQRAMMILLVFLIPPLKGEGGCEQ